MVKQFTGQPEETAAYLARSFSVAVVMGSLMVGLLLMLANVTPASPQFDCDATGHIRYQNLPDQMVQTAISRNIDLNQLRLRYDAGERWIDPARLVKAEGCP